MGIHSQSPFHRDFCSQGVYLRDFYLNGCSNSDIPFAPARGDHDQGIRSPPSA